MFEILMRGEYFTMEGKNWAKVAKDGHEKKEQEARRRQEGRQQKVFDLERQRFQEKDALRWRQTERLDKIERCCTYIERAFSHLKESYNVIGNKDKAYDRAISVLESHLTTAGQLVETVLAAKGKEHKLVQECFQKITDLNKARDQILRTQNEIANIGKEYESEVGGLSSSQADDIEIMERASKLKTKTKELVKDYNTFNQSAEEKVNRIDSFHDRSNEVLKFIQDHGKPTDNSSYVQIFREFLRANSKPTIEQIVKLVPQDKFIGYNILYKDRPSSSMGFRYTWIDSENLKDSIGDSWTEGIHHRIWDVYVCNPLPSAPEGSNSRHYWTLRIKVTECQLEDGTDKYESFYMDSEGEFHTWREAMPMAHERSDDAIKKTHIITQTPEQYRSPIDYPELYGRRKK
jgi:hypothetical protein